MVITGAKLLIKFDIHFTADPHRCFYVLTMIQNNYYSVIHTIRQALKSYLTVYQSQFTELLKKKILKIFDLGKGYKLFESILIFITH